jgi:hypothetical protein
MRYARSDGAPVPPALHLAEGGRGPCLPHKAGGRAYRDAARSRWCLVVGLPLRRHVSQIALPGWHVGRPSACGLKSQGCWIPGGQAV